MSESLPILPDEGPPEAEGSHFSRAHHVLLFFVVAALVAWVLSGFYQVKADQVAIIERLGQYLATPDGKAIQIEHGLHYQLPWPIDRKHIISIQQVKTLQVKTFNAAPAEYDDFKRALLREGNDPRVINALFDPYLISADKSVVHMEISILYRIDDPEAWLNSVSHESDDADSPNDMRHALFQQIAQRAMIAQVARMKLQDVLLEKRDTLPNAVSNHVEDGMQLPDPSDPTGKASIALGIQIQKVEISEVRPPDAVKPAFEDVLKQRVQRSTVQQSAEGDANAMVSKAKGEQDTLLFDAASFKQSTISAAQGETDRFKEVLTQYSKAPDLTRWNLFVDAARSVLVNSKRIMSAQPGQKTIITVDQPQYDAGQVQPR